VARVEPGDPPPPPPPPPLLVLLLLGDGEEGNELVRVLIPAISGLSTGSAPGVSADGVSRIPGVGEGVK